MATDEDKYKIITVNMDVDFLVPMYDDKMSKINGWTVEEIIADWFTGRHNINAYHASRNHSEIGGSKVIKAISVKDV